MVKNLSPFCLYTSKSHLRQLGNTPTAPSQARPSRRRHRLKSLRTLRLPRHLRLPIDLRQRLEVLPAIHENGAEDNRIGTHDLLLVVGVRCAVGAVVAVDGFARVAVVSVGF